MRLLPFNHNRPTEMEDKAHVEAVRYFGEHLRQFPASRDTVKRLERGMAKTALSVVAVAQRAPQGNPIFTGDGVQWHKSVDLFDNIFVCHRQTGDGIEYAVVEHFPANGRDEICNRGRNAEEILKAFTHDERQTLQIWTEDVSAQAKEFLAEKYPGQDMIPVADAFIRKFTTQAASHRHAISHNHHQKRGRGIGI